MEIGILLVALLAGGAAGLFYRMRNGKIRAVTDPAVPESAEAAAREPGLSARAGMLRAVGVGTVPTVLHFSADWCGPCAAVRRVIAQVVQDLGPDYGPGVLEVELDLDENPQLARELNVLSLPTTFIYDSAGTERFRIAGVPKAPQLRDALASIS